MTSWAEAYIELGMEHLQKTSRRDRSGVVRLFAEWYDQTRRSPRKVTQDDLVRYHLKGGLDRNKLCNRTVNQYWGHVKQFLTWCMETERLPTKMSLLNAVKPLPVEQVDKVRLDGQAIASMLDGIKDQRDRALMYAFANTGSRASELRQFRVGGVRLDESPIELRGYNQKKRRWFTKFGTPQLERELRAYLTWYLSDECRKKPTELPPEQWLLFPTRTYSSISGFTYNVEVPITGMARVVQLYTAPIMGRVRYQGAAHTLRRSAANQVRRKAGAKDGVAIGMHMLDHQDEKVFNAYSGTGANEDLAREFFREDFLPDVGSVQKLRKVE